jgi:hypothetical protein
LNKTFLALGKTQGTSNTFKEKVNLLVDGKRNPKLAESHKQWENYSKISSTMNALHSQQKEMNYDTSCRFSSAKRESDMQFKSSNIKRVFENYYQERERSSTSFGFRSRSINM